MTPEWYLQLLNDPQGFWKLLHYYLTAPFSESGMSAELLTDFFQSLLNHPLIGMVIVLLLLLLGGAMLVSGIAVSSETRREKKERMEKILAEYRKCVEEAGAQGLLLHHRYPVLTPKRKSE